MITTKRESYQISEQMEFKHEPKRDHGSFWMLYLFFIILLAFFIIIITLISFHSYEGSSEKLKPLGLMDWNYGGDNKTSNLNCENYVTISFDKHNQQQLRGLIYKEQDVMVARFLGVKYSPQPKRFQRSFPSDPWSGVYDALSWPPQCVQNHLHNYDYLTKIYNYNISEDCLFLNVWTPHTDVTSGVNRTSKVNGNKSLLPVIIYLHGGGFSNMGISMEAYDGSIISALGKVVFVTLNYRVGLFGFFNNELEHLHKEYVANAGLYDQMVAIEWVRKNIQLFGGKCVGGEDTIPLISKFIKGNPNVITLQGQSAGAISAGLHMISPVSQKLFQRAILQSSSPMMMKPMFTTNRYDHIIQLANCTQHISSTRASTKQHKITTKSEESSVVTDNDIEDLVTAENEDNAGDDDNEHISAYETSETEKKLAETRCLENLSLQKLQKIQSIMLNENIISFSPSLPSKFFPEFAEEAFDKGVAEENTITQHEVLMGVNINESTLYIHQEFKEIFPLRDITLNVSRAELVQMMQKIFGNTTLGNTFISMIFKEIARKNIYVNDEIVLTKEVLTFIGDLIFKGPVFKYAIALQQNTNSDVYLYEFHEAANNYPEWIGSGHWNEMDFVFGIPFRYRNQFTDKQRQLSARIIQTWATFARTGKMLSQFGVTWPKFDNEHRQHMNLAESNSSIGSNLDMSYYEFFDVMYEAF